MHKVPSLKHGVALIVLALGLVLLCIFAVLVLDSARVLAGTQEAQGAADAAALAGASAFLGDRRDAVPRARDYAAKNTLYGVPFAPMEINTAISGDTIAVLLHREVKTILGRTNIWGRASASIDQHHQHVVLVK